MASITPVSSLDSWFVREQPISSKFNSELRDKVNTIISNHVLINNSLEELFQGASGGAQQAKIPFGLASAPTGWTRDLSISNDHTLRVTDGSTLPPGASPIVTGGSEGGAWSIIGVTTDSIANHDHTLASHTHVLANHTHDVDSHTHGSGGHTHTPAAHTSHSYSSDILPHGGASFTGTVDAPSPAEASPAGSHTHAGTDHTHSIDSISFSGASSTGSETGNPTSSPSSSGSGGSTSNGPSTNTSGRTGSHNHSVSNDGTWRPQYLNVLLCKKD